MIGKLSQKIARCVVLLYVSISLATYLSVGFSAAHFVARMTYAIENVIGYAPSDGTCPFCFPPRGHVSSRKHAVETTEMLDFLKEIWNLCRIHRRMGLLTSKQNLRRTRSARGARRRRTAPRLPLKLGSKRSDAKERLMPMPTVREKRPRQEQSQNPTETPR